MIHFYKSRLNLLTSQLSLFLSLILSFLLSGLILSCSSSSSSSKKNHKASNNSSDTNTTSSLADISFLTSGTYKSQCIKDNTTGLSNIKAYRFSIKIQSQTNSSLENEAQVFSDVNCSETKKILKFNTNMLVSKITPINKKTGIYKLQTELEKADLTPYDLDSLKSSLSQIQGFDSIFDSFKLKNNQTTDITSNLLLLPIVSEIVGNDITASSVFIKNIPPTISVASSEKDLQTDSSSKILTLTLLEE